MINQFSRLCGVSVSDLRSDKREHDITDARHIFHYILVRKKGFSLNAAGRETNKDHSTVANSVKRVSEMLINTKKPDARFAAIWEKVASIITTETMGVRGWRVK